MEKCLSRLASLLEDADFPWALCGGYALELFVGRPVRPHGDIDVCVPESARAQLVRCMLRKGWRVLEYRGMGLVRPILQADAGEAGRNLMCLRADCGLVELFPSGQEGLMYHRFTPGDMSEINFLDVLFCDLDDSSLWFDRRAGIVRRREKAILRREGLPILAPEIALLYKAGQPEEPRHQADFDAAYACMDGGQRQWFRAALETLYPQGHLWSSG